MPKLNIFIEERIATVGSYFNAAFGNFLPEEEVEEVYSFVISNDVDSNADIVANFVERRNLGYGYADFYKSETGNDYIIQHFNIGKERLYIKGRTRFIRVATQEVKL